MANYFNEEKIIKLIKKGMPVDLAIHKAALSAFGIDEEKETDEVDNYQCEYIELVYPPGSNPLTRNSIKKMNLFGFNQFSLV